MAHINSSIEGGLEALSGEQLLTGPEENNRNAQVVLVGLNHRSAPMEIRQQVSFSKDQLPDALQRLKSDVSDGIILSTCSRTEVYTMGHSPERSARRVMEFIHRYHGLDQGFANPYLYVRSGGEAASHLFNVTAGLDSVVLGEWQILGQVRQALKAAAAHNPGTMPASLYRLFHGAVETGRKAREDTGFGETGTHLGQAVLQCAKAKLGDIANARVLIIGAGEVARLTAHALCDSGVGEMTIANRSLEHGMKLAYEVGASVVAHDDLALALRQADIVVSATGAPGFTVTKYMLADAREHNSTRELLCVDLAVPPDIDPQVATLENVRTFDIEQVQRSAVESSIKSSGKSSGDSGNEAAAAAMITKEGLGRFNTWLDSLDAVPRIRKLQQRAESIRQQELEKSLRKLNGLTDEQLAAIDTLTRSIVKKLLHEPIQALKESAGQYEPWGHAPDGTRELRSPDTFVTENRNIDEVFPTAGGQFAATP
ncbi:MAG: glutamyl-tRNA reductase [SAR202 cluster bacterium]|nr:glutamyl-tRNA reductase [SAR202 cluster bacterium]